MELYWSVVRNVLGNFFDALNYANQPKSLPRGFSLIFFDRGNDCRHVSCSRNAIVQGFAATRSSSTNPVTNRYVIESSIVPQYETLWLARYYTLYVIVMSQPTMKRRNIS